MVVLVGLFRKRGIAYRLLFSAVFNRLSTGTGLTIQVGFYPGGRFEMQRQDSIPKGSGELGSLQFSYNLMNGIWI